RSLWPSKTRAVRWTSRPFSVSTTFCLPGLEDSPGALLLRVGLFSSASPTADRANTPNNTPRHRRNMLISPRIPLRHHRPSPYNNRWSNATPSPEPSRRILSSGTVLMTTATAAPMSSADVSAIEQLRTAHGQLRREIGKVIVGQEHVLDQLLMA